MICRHGGLTFIQYNELWDLTANWLQPVCHDVSVEPSLLPLNGELLPVTVVIVQKLTSMQGASGAGDKVHCLTLGLFIPMHQVIISASLFRRHKLEKKCEYGDCTHVVDGESFTPLVFSTFGGLGKEATIFYNCLAN